MYLSNGSGYLSNGSGYRWPTGTSKHQAFELIYRCILFNLLMLQRNVYCFETDFSFSDHLRYVEISKSSTRTC